MDKNLKREPLVKDFYIYVSPHHTFGTDAVVLRNFANPKQKDRVVDLGTGCGIIPFLMIRDIKTLSAVGVDISAEAIALAKKTAADLNLNNFVAINSDLKDLKGKIEFGSHTLVTCNPPYKAENAGIKNPDKVDMVALKEKGKK